MGTPRGARPGAASSARRGPPRPTPAATACSRSTSTRRSRAAWRVLTAYQDAALAQRYRALVERVRAAETRVSGGHGALTVAVARNYFKLLAIKDEYEVARLYSDGEFERQVAANFEGDYTLRYHFAPPLWVKPDKVTGAPVKRTLRPVDAPRARAPRALQGPARHAGSTRSATPTSASSSGAWSPTTRRRSTSSSAGSRADNLALAVEIAALPATIRGYGHVKRRNIDAAKSARGRAARGIPRARGHADCDRRVGAALHCRHAVARHPRRRPVAHPVRAVLLDVPRGHGRRGHQDRGRRRRRPGAPPGHPAQRLQPLLRVVQPQQALDDARPAQRRGQGGAAQADRHRRRRARQLPSRRDGEDRPVARRASAHQARHRQLPHHRLRPRRPVPRPARRSTSSRRR